MLIATSYTRATNKSLKGHPGSDIEWSIDPEPMHDFGFVSLVIIVVIRVLLFNQAITVRTVKWRVLGFSEIGSEANITASIIDVFLLILVIGDVLPLV